MNFLVDILPPKTRRYVYGGVALLGLAITAWQAADHDWKTAAMTLVGSAVTALAHANTDPSSEDPHV